MQQVGLRERHPLGPSCGARGVEDRGQAAFRSLGRLEHGRAMNTTSQQLLPAQQGHRGSGGWHLAMQQQHKAQASQGASGLQRLQQAGVFQHQGPGAAIAKDVGELFHRGLAAAHGIGGPEPHQALIHRQPAGPVLGELRHHITGTDALGCQTSRHQADALVQCLEAEALRRWAMGGFHRRDGSMALGQQRPEAINSFQSRPIGLLLQGPLISAIPLPAHQSVSHRSPASCAESAR